MSTFEVMMPISPQIEQGTITVNIRSLSQIRRQDIAVEVEILVGPFPKLKLFLIILIKNIMHDSQKELLLLDTLP